MTIIKQDYEELVRERMSLYYDEVLNHRAIPETKDGLMEVQRRILWSCYAHGWFSNKQHVKCAKINGMAMTYHPHGDASIYEVLVNLSQDWKNHICLIDTSGNNGSIYGDPAAAPRYLEARLTKDASLIYLDELKSDCVDMVDNYDLTEKEPLVLPGRIPMYFINGSFGIAGGYSISVPTHNPVETIDEAIKLIDDPSYNINLLPDFPTGCTISTDDALVKEGYDKGRGNIIVRGTFERDEANHRLILREIPYMKSLDKIAEEIKICSKEQKESNTKKMLPAKIPGIKNVIDGSKNNLIEFLIEVKKDYPLELVENQLFQYTQVQTTIPIILLGTRDRKFVEYLGDGTTTASTQVMKEWIEFRRVTIKRVKLGLIKKYKTRTHIIVGLLKILDPKVIDKVVAMIKKCKNKREVMDKLMSIYKLTDMQAESIAMLYLYKLSAMSITELEDEKTELAAKIDSETSFFKHIDKIDSLIKTDLLEFREKYAHIKRKTRIISSFSNLKEGVVENTEHTLIVTKAGYIKKLSPINSQRRNGKGVNVGKLKDDDYPVFVEELSNKDGLFIFTEIGKVYKYGVRDLLESTTSTLGNYISATINGETITSCIRIPYDIKPKGYGIMISTKLNKIKVTDLSEFINMNKSGVIASKLNDGDSIISASLVRTDTDVSKEVIITNNGGNSSLIDIEDIPLVARTTFGSNAMSSDIIKKGYEIVSASARKDEDTHVLVVSKKGYGKLVPIAEFSKVRRGAKGMMCAKVREDDSILKVMFCNSEQELTLVSNKSIIKINVSDISEMKRPTFGVSLKNVTEDEELVDISLI